MQAICPQGVRTRMLEEAGPIADVLIRDGALEPEDVADAVWQGMQDDRFLILPHPEVAEYYVNRATSTETWLHAMRKLQRRLDDVTPAERCAAPDRSDGASNVRRGCQRVRYGSFR